MTTDARPRHAAYMAADQVGQVVGLLETDFGRTDDRREGSLYHQALLDVLDRGDHGHCLVWPAHDPRAVCHVGAGGRLLPAGDPHAAHAFAQAASGDTWRVLIGEQAIGDALVAAWGRRFWRRTNVREQRFMRVLPEEIAELPPPDGMRSARMADLDPVTELAARLHVEDLMRPPLSRSGRMSVRSRMAESIRRGDTFVVVRDGRVVGKTDVSLYSNRRGGQIAGVYVDRSARGEGIATALVAAVARALALEGLPGVTLHVRVDNHSAIAAYRRAGFTDRGPLSLALR